jgi:hypothetical protein
MSKKAILYFVLIATCLVVLAGIFLTSRPLGQNGQVSGAVFLATPSAKLITLREEKGNIIILDLSSPDFTFSDDSGSGFSLADLRRGFLVEASGSWSDKKTLLVNSLRLIEVPNISVFTPSDGEEVGIPLVGSGEARVFESAYRYRLLDADGSILAEGFDTANAPDMGQFGTFSFSLFYPVPKGKTGTLEVFDNSAKDGAEIDMVRVPVVFKSDISKDEDKMDVQVFFTNSVKDPKTEQCEKTYPITRAIKKTPTPARSVLDLLLLGPNDEEKTEGYGTTINEGVAIKGINIEQGVATIDFNKRFMEEVGGSCRIMAMRSQIENTLKQFSSIKEVIVSVEGKTEGVLEP